MVEVSHRYLWEVISRLGRDGFRIVGVVEEDDYLWEHNGLRDKLDPNLFYVDLGEMLSKTHPEAIIVYEPIHGHLRVVEACAPRGIHVMIGKPLAVNNEHAARMASLAREKNILLLTSYETTWYNANYETFRFIDGSAIGKVDRTNMYGGHRGPFETDCEKEFTDWLTDPVLNGGGAVIDLGCYGANLAAHLMKDEKPLSIYAVLRQSKPNLYPKVDDGTTIIVEYPPATVQITGSWCWPMGRKDMHIHGDKGYVYQDTPKGMRIHTNGREHQGIAPSLNAPHSDSFYFLEAAVCKEIDIPPTDLPSLESNPMVVRILNAAVQGARSKAVIQLL